MRFDLHMVRRVLDRMRERLRTHPELGARTAEYLANRLPGEGDDDKEAAPQTQTDD